MANEMEESRWRKGTKRKLRVGQQAISQKGRSHCVDHFEALLLN